MIRMLFCVRNTIGEMNENIPFKIEQNAYAKHHQIDKKLSNFHTF